MEISIGDIFVPFISLIDSQKKLVTTTGLATFSVLKIVELLGNNFPDSRHFCIKESS